MERPTRITIAVELEEEIRLDFSMAPGTYTLGPVLCQEGPQDRPDGWITIDEVLRRWNGER